MSTEHLLQNGIALARAGKALEARPLLEKYLAENPDNDVAWLYLAGIATDAATAQKALAQVERLNPQNPHLPKAKAWAAQQWPVPPPTPPPPPPKRRRWLIPAVALVAATVLAIAAIAATNAIPRVRAAFSTPARAIGTPSAASQWMAMQTQLIAAEASGDTTAIKATLADMLAIAPQNSTVALKLATFYYDDGLAQKSKGDFSSAIASFEKALSIFPSFEAAQTEVELAKLYQKGVNFYQNAEWEDAANTFEIIFGRNPDYPFVDEILYSTYFNLGLMKTHSDNLETALLAYRRAAEVFPSGTEAAEKADALFLQLYPPTPTPIPVPTITPTPQPTTTPEPSESSGKEVIVDISEQRTYLYQDDELVETFIVSTGEPGRDTAPGHYQILDKIPMAYASTWNLDMPFWLGIYWSGPLENGFHAVPTVRDTGITMWDGYLGQRVSYGCIILSLADAETLYNWVDIGTDVTIQY